MLGRNSFLFVVVVSLVMALTSSALLAAGLSSSGLTRVAQNAGTVSVDNSGSQGAATGRVVDDSGWPTVVVALKNDHTFWLKSSVWATLGDVAIDEDDPRTNTWARLGYIPPGSEAVHVLRFVPAGISTIQFFVNAGRTHDGSLSAGVVTTLQRTIDTILTAVGGSARFQDASLQTLVDGIDQFTELSGCVDAVEGVLRQNILDVAAFSTGFVTCLTDEKQLAVLAGIASQFGTEVTKDTLKNVVFTPLKLVELSVQVGDTLLAIATDSWAGSVVFNGSAPPLEGRRTDSQVPTVPAEVSSFTIIDLGTLGGDESRAVEINEAGQIVGVAETAGGEMRAVLWENGQIRELTTLTDETRQESERGDNSALSSFQPVSINDVGQIVGYVDTAVGDNYAALWENGEVTDLGTLGGGRWATSINNTNQIIGNSWTGDANGSGDERAVTWVDGQIRELGTLGGNTSTAFGINDAGQIVGDASTAEGESHRHAVLWENGQITDLGTLGGIDSGASGINEAGQIVGLARTANGDIHAALWNNGTAIDLGTLGGQSRAFEINDVGQIVGWSEIAEGGVHRHAVLWENGEVTDLGTLGGNDSTASGINEAGQIVGSATIAGGETHAVLWQPTAANMTAQPLPSPGSTPGPLETSTGASSASVPMHGGNPGHTGEMPGPGPQGNPVELWRAEVGDILTPSPAVANGLVYIGSEDGNLYAFDAATGIERWHYFTGDAIGSSPAIADGVVYVTSGNGTIYAVDAMTGAERWSFFLGGDRTALASPTVADGVVYVGGMGNLYALDAATGAERWRYEICCPNETSPSVVDGVVYLVATGSNDLVALDAATGTERWRFETPGQVWSLPVVADGMVYFGTAVEGHVFALDAATGTERWRFPVGELVSTLAVVDGAVYVGSSDDGRLHALDAATGVEQWVFPTGGEINYSSPAVVDGTVYFGIDGDDSGTLYAIDATTGEERWSFFAGDRILSSPAVINGIVYVGVTMYGDVEGGVVAIGGDAGTFAILVEGSTVLVAENTALRGAPNPGSVEVAQLSAGTQVTLGAAEGSGDDRWWHVTVNESGLQGWLPAEVLKPAV